MTYIMVARMTPRLKRVAARVEKWRELDEDYAGGEFHLRLWNSEREWHFVVICERLRDEKYSLGRKLFDVPGYTFRMFVTNREEAPEQVWRDYNPRADVEKWIAELKYDLAADDFCLHEFFATEAAFLAILRLLDLLAGFQRAVGMVRYRQPATLRGEVFLCGAILGRAGHRTVLHLPSAWRGWEHRNTLFENLLAYFLPTSPKSNLELATWTEIRRDAALDSGKFQTSTSESGLMPQM